MTNSHQMVLNEYVNVKAIWTWRLNAAIYFKTKNGYEYRLMFVHTQTMCYRDSVFWKLFWMESWKIFLLTRNLTKNDLCDNILNFTAILGLLIETSFATKLKQVFL